MINMIKADIYRVSRGIGIYIALALMIGMIALSLYDVGPASVGLAYVGGKGIDDVSTNKPYNSELDHMSYEEIQDLSMSEYREIMLRSKGYELDRDILSYNMNLYYVFLFFAALAVTVDFSAGSIKNTLSSPISRKRYFFSKILFITMGCLVLFFLNTYITYFANLFFNGKGLSSSLATVTKISLLQLPPILVLISIQVGLAFLVKRTAVYNTVSIPLVIVVQLLFSAVIKIFHVKEKYIYYELQLMLGKLANNPSNSYLLHSYLLCGAMIVALTWIGWCSFKRTEIG